MPSSHKYDAETDYPMQLLGSSFRWLVLVAYMLTGIFTQIIWITFAPILSLTAQTYGVTQADVGNLSTVFPLVYVVISIPVGYLIDSYGFRKAILLGTGFMAVFGLMRAFSPNFTFLLIFQALAGVSQPFIMNSITKLVKGWFPEKEVGIATGLGSLSLFIGMILGLVLTPLLVDMSGLNTVLLIYGASSVAVSAVFFFLGKEPKAAMQDKEMVKLPELKGLFKNRNNLILSALFFICIGVFTAFTTWIEPIMGVQNISVESAGLLGGVMIIGGIIGSMIIPALSDKLKTRKKPLLLSLLVSGILWIAMTALTGDLLVGLVIFWLGFFFMTLLPLGLEISAESVEKKYLGSANALLWEFSQIGCLTLIVLYEFLGNSQSWSWTLIFSGVITLVGIPLAYALKEKLADPAKAKSELLTQPQLSKN
jgi:predicted MFS family arabinose efflux permease